MNTGLILADFQRVGTVCVVSDKLMIEASGPEISSEQSFSIFGGSWSIPVALFRFNRLRCFRTYQEVMNENLKIHLVRRGFLRQKYHTESFNGRLLDFNLPIVDEK